MPGLVNQTLTAAEAELRQLGVRVSVERVVTASPGLDGLVLRQRPAASVMILPGSLATLIVGRYDGPPVLQNTSTVIKTTATKPVSINIANFAYSPEGYKLTVTGSPDPGSITCNGMICVFDPQGYVGGEVLEFTISDGHHPAVTLSLTADIFVLIDPPLSEAPACLERAPVVG